MAVTMTSIRLDTHLADEAVKVLGVKSRTEAVHVALREIVALKRFKDLMKKNAGKLSFPDRSYSDVFRGSGGVVAWRHEAGRTGILTDIGKEPSHPNPHGKELAGIGTDTGKNSRGSRVHPGQATRPALRRTDRAQRALLRCPTDHVQPDRF